MSSMSEDVNEMHEATASPEGDGPREAATAPPQTQTQAGAPRTTTHHEVAYLRRLIEANTTVSVKIRGGDVFTGVIEYYDASFIRITRDGQPNLFIFKKDIVYLREEAPAAS